MGKQQEDARGEFDIDYGRVVHSGSFRRLQGKTQILNLGDSDFYRTRLTIRSKSPRSPVGSVVSSPKPIPITRPCRICRR
ncbi:MULTISPECIES: hypothetical protein [unclassified Bradyrhizobium]|uniref:hypothetical protein n=1 Tax=unclassified Bradyrhizobium TaxID=2631580 RepID=UPI00230563F8|nr:MULTISPECIES: hypothetical protein [unclassified Bradyrhizobium]